MRFQCENSHVFHYPAKLVTVGLPKESISELDLMLSVSSSMLQDEELKPLIDIIKAMRGTFDIATLERSVCPECRTIKFSEYVEPEQETENVLVIELSTGPQMAIDKALGEGYKIVGRYAKQYILEKPKAKEASP